MTNSSNEPIKSTPVFLKSYMLPSTGSFGKKRHVRVNWLHCQVPESDKFGSDAVQYIPKSSTTNIIIGSGFPHTRIPPSGYLQCLWFNIEITA